MFKIILLVYFISYVDSYRLRRILKNAENAENVNLQEDEEKPENKDFKNKVGLPKHKDKENMEKSQTSKPEKKKKPVGLSWGSFRLPQQLPANDFKLIMDRVSSFRKGEYCPDQYKNYKCYNMESQSVIKMIINDVVTEFEKRQAQELKRQELITSNTFKQIVINKDNGTLRAAPYYDDRISNHDFDDYFTIEK